MDLTTMEGACASTERFVEAVRPAHLSNPTPCADWDVRALLNHVTGTLHLGAALLSDSVPTVNMGPGELPDTDLLGDDPAKAYRLGVEALLAAAAGDALERTHTTPLGAMPGAVLGGFTTLDILVHGWDLAKATGQDATLPTDVAETVLGFARQTLTGEDTRGTRIGPPVAVDADAGATARLVGYLGRRP
ncbi:MAG: TIGR03086 family metal-binding protein [Acidimicrobiales bacterium]